MPTNTVRYLIELRDKMSKSLAVIDKNVTKTDKKVSSLGSTLAKLGALAAVGIVVKSIVTLGIEMEQTRVAFATMLGDGEKANKLIGQLNEFANITPFDNAAVIAGGKALLTASIPAENIVKTLKAVGDVAAGSGNKLQEVANIYAKGMNKGKIQTEELMQLTERSIPFLDVLAERFGVTKAEVLKMGEKSLISSQMMADAFETMSGSGGKFDDAMVKLSKTVGGRISTLTGMMQTLGIGIGEAINPALGVLVDLGVALASNVEVLKTLAMVVGIAALAWVAFQVPAAIAAVKASILAAKLWLVNVALAANPIGIIVLALAALGVAFVIAWRHSDKFRATMMGLWEVIKVIFGNMKKTFMELPTLVLDAFKDIPRALLGLFDGIGNIIKAVLSGNFKALPDLLKTAGKDLVRINPLAGAAINIGKALAEGTGGAFNKAFDKEMLGAGSDALGIDGVPKADDITGGGGGGGAGGGGAGSKTKASSTTIKSAAPKTFNLTIGSLIAENNINTTTLTEGVTELQQTLVEALIGATNDVQTSI